RPRLTLACQCALLPSPQVAVDERFGRPLDEYLRKSPDLAASVFARLPIRALDRGLDDDSAASGHELAHPRQLARLGIALVLGRGAAKSEHLFHLGPVEHVDDFSKAPQAVG